MKKIKFVTLAVLVLAAAYYATYTTYNTKHQLTDLVLLNIEALAVDESDYADPIRFKQCYTFTSTTLLPDYPAEYVTTCYGCYTVKSTTHINSLYCAGAVSYTHLVADQLSLVCFACYCRTADNLL